MWIKIWIDTNFSFRDPDKLIKQEIYKGGRVGNLIL